MNETIRVIKNRRSIRKYKAEQIADGELETILEAAINAPNGMNQQKWHFTVVQNPVVIDKMVNTAKENIMSSNMEFLKERASRPDFHVFHHAPTVIIITGDEKARFVDLDCAAAAENIALAAESLGIGSCLMATPELVFISEKGQALKGELGIPDGYVHQCTVTLGYKAESPEAKPRSRGVINYIR